MKITILGAGAYGTALGGILADNGYDIDYYDPAREREKLKDAVHGAEVIALSAPSDVVTKLLGHLPRDKFLIVACKGFLTKAPFVEFKDWAVLSGAGFADDIKTGKTVWLTATDKRVVEMFAAQNIKFDMTDDELGVLMCGALKNVYAIRAGELGLKRNTKRKEDFIYRVVKEMAGILRENGAKSGTIQLACGMKDLMLTAGPDSRNYQFGQMLKSGSFGKTEMTVEGVSAIHRVKRGEIIVPESASILRGILAESDKWNKLR